MKFSVIIPLYNKATTVSRSIYSLLDQKYRDFEIIVVDDGSTDDGVDVVRSIHDPRIRIIQQPNGGVSKARNTGISISTAPYITFLDADDIYLPGYFEEMNRLITRFPHAAFWGSAYYIQQENGNTVCSYNSPGNDPICIENYFLMAAHCCPLVHTSTICIPRNQMSAIGGFPEDIKSGEDLLTWARIAAIGSLGFSPTPLAVYLQNSPDSTGIKRFPDQNDAVGQGLIQLLSVCPQNKHALRHYISYYYRGRGVHAIECGLKNMARKALFRSIYYNNRNWKSYVHFLMTFFPARFSRRILFTVKMVLQSATKQKKVYEK